MQLVNLLICSTSTRSWSVAVVDWAPGLVARLYDALQQYPESKSVYVSGSQNLLRDGRASEK